MQNNINFHIWFKVCRPLKHKHKLSTNCLLVLNGAYLLYLLNNKGFTMYKLRSFVGYYNANRIRQYITVLIDNKFITQSGSYKSRLLYIISSKGIEVMKELNDSYNNSLYSFCSKYSIEL